MFFSKSSSSRNLKAMVEALDKSQAIIEFSPNGIILNANENFLRAMGYSLVEVKGQHHQMFVEPAYADSADYEQFWNNLRRGAYQAAEYKRLGKGNHEVWIQASYNPLVDSNGKVFKVIKYATDITSAKLQTADYTGQIAAIGKSQAVIQFDLDGTITDANSNFLDTVGYSLDEIKGRHHRMFVDPAEAASPAYKTFWEKLGHGEYQAADYKRIGKDGREIWIQASYNPIFDMNGKPFKVVKYATDITEQKRHNADYSGQIAAISKSQAVIEFELDGTIITANNNFLNTLGYTLDEVQGQHHRMFVEPSYAISTDYQNFWDRLGRGEYQAAEYKRIGKGGREVWILASYNPILDTNGKPFKVVKYATDITLLMATRLEVGELVNLTSANIQSVAAATEEMASSISEISKSMNLSKGAVEEIVQKTQIAGTASSNLQHSAQSMENIVGLIRKIADQVNLLALNATIEAARAGQAGKGFAVVADEVKNLAMQTRAATDNIAGGIAAIQSISNEVAESVNEIIRTSDLVSEYVNTVASAIEEQSAVTQDISANTQHTSSAVSDIHDCVKRLSAA